MKIQEYIRDQVFARRASENGCLVIYDPERRYQGVARSMATKHHMVIEVEDSLLVERENALDALGKLASGEIHQLMVWLPIQPAVEVEQKQKDPFAVFADLGASFPAGDGDEFIDICRRAMPQHVSEINRMFKDGVPSFEMLNALEGGGSWPTLKTILRAGSPKEILVGILSPTPAQTAALKAHAKWCDEAKDMIHRSLGHWLKTRGKTQQSVSDELWQLLLFSEFVFDANTELPEGLETVPLADENAKGLVYDVCATLRRNDDHKELYKSKAQEVEDALHLASKARAMQHLGVRDTFACEERIFLDLLVEHAEKGAFEEAKQVWESRRQSIWIKSEERLMDWSLAEKALEVLEATRDFSKPTFTSLEAIVEDYALVWRRLDRHHREMEQAANQIRDDHEGLARLLDLARAAYLNCVETIQAEFVRLVQSEGWPVSNGKLLWNRQLFSKVVDPILENGERVAYFLVDSLRYELGIELEKQLAEDFKVDIVPVCAQLPTYTEVGMASLMPEAENALSLLSMEGTIAPTLDGKAVSTPQARFEYLKRIKGDQCADLKMDDLIRNKRKAVPEKVKLLVVRTHEIDTIAHTSTEQILDALPSLIRKVIRGLRRVRELGFDQAVIATDHGFVLFHEQGAGNVARKPPGDWKVQKSRCLLGVGDQDAHSVVLNAKEVGIPGDIKNYAAPKTFAPYSRGHSYYHEGLSLQECVLPCVTVQLQSTRSTSSTSDTNLILSYRQGKVDKITTRRPVLDLSWPEAQLFAEESERELAIEAVDSKGNVVGVVGSGQAVNPATGLLRIRPGTALSFGLKMELSFSGRFTVRVLDPSTNATLAQIALKTAYLQ